MSDGDVKGLTGNVPEEGPADAKELEAQRVHVELAAVERKVHQAKEDPRVPIDRLRRTSPDPWKHRGDAMHCSTCMWYVAKNAPQNVTELGRCRRHAPTMNGYPVVFPVDWCGDHKLDEMKA